MSKTVKATSIDTKKMSGELFALSYGALVSEMLRDLEDPLQVNMQLDKVGFNMGTRLADDFLAKQSTAPRCSDIRQMVEMADTLARVALPAYLGVPASVWNWGAGEREFSLLLDTNPLTELVAVPPHLGQLCYSQLIAGAIRGALEALHVKVAASVVDNSSCATEIRIRFESILKDNLPAGEDD